ncbi:hypothetical protein CGCTS75_v006361 [Colletotrichum tropicale]|nr:hypothetical protein CGCTS75_v006361 [Colletotrichum tropicale]
MLLRPIVILWLLSGIANTQFPDEEELDKPVSISGTRERTRLHARWRFWRSDSIPDGVVYERRPDANGDELAELKPWIMPTANEFIADPANQHQSPDSQPAVNISFASPIFDDSNWENVT